MNSPYLMGLTKKDWLCLSFLSGVGPARLSRLHTYLDTLEMTCTEDHSRSVSHRNSISYEVLKSLKWPDETAHQAMNYLESNILTKEQNHKCEQTLHWLESEKNNLIFQNDELYPMCLKEISVAPTFLYLEGNVDLFKLPKIGIVGSRKCSPYGAETAFQFSYELSCQGICIVSGGALGIDTAAHLGALKSTTTPTLAVMGTGLLHRYPNKNKSLFDKILNQNGTLLSEYPLDTSPKAHLFPPRNRLISGLSLGVLVAEASIKSGSLISASYAVQQNREVFTLPGRLSDPQSSGCHQLIRQGATLVRNTKDLLVECFPDYLGNRGLQMKSTYENRELFIEQEVVEENVSRENISLNQSKNNKKVTNLPSSISEGARLIAAFLEDQVQNYGVQFLDFDALIRHTRMDASKMMQSLMELELCACIGNREGLYYRM